MKKYVLSFLTVLMLLFVSCNSWMKDDDFYSDIEHDVKVANAHKIDVYVSYAMTKQGKTDPDGTTTFKVEIPQTISAVTETEYAFVRWAAFTTSFLYTGDQQSKNKDFIYIDEKDYKEKFEEYEIKSPVVVFENQNSPITTVTINEERNDLFIVPIVAHRPTIAITIPAAGSKDIVRNMAIRISFSKQMDETSFYNEFGECDKITVTQGNMVISSTGDFDTEYEDITKYFAKPYFSSSYKTITLMFDSESEMKSFKAQSTISVTISKDVKDACGFSMADDEKLSFTVGSSMDSLPPRITQFTGGIGTDIIAFSSMYQNKETVEKIGILTKISDQRGSSDAPVKEGGLNDSFYDDNLFAQRVKDKVIVRVAAEDISESQTGSGIESDVSRIGLRAKALYDIDGKPFDSSFTGITSIDKAAEAYASQYNFAPSVSGLYANIITNAYLKHYGVSSESELTAAQRSELSSDKSKGCLYEIDLSALPDGLIRIDVAAIDNVQNSGYSITDEEIVKECGNGYASIFVVKDSTPPDTSENYSYISTVSNQVPYGWYNDAEYKGIKLVDQNHKIHDKGFNKLISKSDKLKWIVKSTNDTSWGANISVDDSGWKYINDQNGYSFENAKASDGAVSFTYALMDDLQNISEVGVIENFNIYLDTVSPVINSLKWESDANVTAGIATGQLLDTQTLSVNFTEVTAGVKTLALNVEKVTDHTESAKPFENSNLKIIYIPDDTSVPSKELIKNTDYEIDGTNKKIIFTNPCMSGFLKVKGIKISDTQSSAEGSYNIKVKLEDTALNKDINTADNDKSKSITLLNDSTKPIIEKISVPGIKKATNFTDSKVEYWISKDYVQAATNDAGTVQLPVTISINENNSGISHIELNGVTNLNNARIFVSDGGNKVEVTDLVTISPSGTNSVVIEINDTEKALKSSTAESFDLIIENASFITSAENNKISLAVKVSDVANNESLEKNSISSKTGNVSIENVEEFYVDFSIPASTAKLYDNNNETSVAAADGYTNNSYVDYSISLEASNFFSGINSIVLENATFDNTTNIEIDGNQVDKISISTNKNILSFKDANADYIVKPTGSKITIHNIKLPDSDGQKNIKVRFLTLSEREQLEEKSIILDTVSPVFTNGSSSVYLDITKFASGDSEKIYPHPVNEDDKKVSGHTIDDKIYFYTAVNNVVINVDTNDTNINSEDYWYIDSDYTVLDTYSNGAKKIDVSNKVSGNIILKDKAGNISAQKIPVVLVPDTKKPSRTIDGSDYTVQSPASVGYLVTIQVPEGGKLVTNDITQSHKFSKADGCTFADSEVSYAITTYDYILKKTSDENQYKIVIKLATGVNSGDTLLDGPANKNFAAYTDLYPSENSSGIEFYSVANTYYHYDSSTTSNTQCNDGYFPYFPLNTTGFDGFESNSKYQTRSLSTWHQYKNTTSYNEDNRSHNGGAIKSRVNEDGNIEIIIPQDKKNVSPISLLLKDGTGNVEFINLKPVSMESQNDRRRGSEAGDYSHVPNLLWIVDSGIGECTGSDRNVIICPYSTVDSNKNNDGMLRIDSTTTNYYIAQNRASSYQYDRNPKTEGNSVTGTIVKNLVEHVNYYNDNAVIDLVIPVGTEQRVFDTYTAGYVQETQYSLKSKLLAVKQSDPAPTRRDFEMIKDSRASEWSYCKITTSNWANMFHFYPHPEAEWSNNEPYYIYYCVEDAVGNCEINKIVNDSKDEMNLWLYDNDAPVITIRDTAISPAAINGHLIEKLLPNNNGYKSYFDGTKGYVRKDSNKRGSRNESLGTGTTRHVEGAGDDRENIMFFDIEVKSEVTGIRAFCYTDSDAAPKFSSVVSANNTQGDNNKKWYAGNSQTNIDAVIGSSFTYGSDSANAYMKENLSYGDKYYSGTKINTVIPYQIIDGETALETGKKIYLHVMDWTGNVATYAMGDFGLCLYDEYPEPQDNPPSEYQSSCFIGKEEEGLIIELAGSSNESTKKVYLPENWFLDTKGIYGWATEDNDVGKVKFDNGKSYIELNTLEYSDTSTEKTFYVYNNVGQSCSVNIKVKKDSISPDLDLYLRSENSASAKAGNIYQKEVGINDSKNVDSKTYYKISDCTTVELYDSSQDIDANSKYVYISEDFVRFLPYSKEIDSSCPLQLFVYKWGNGQWASIHSSTSSNTNNSLWGTNWVNVPGETITQEGDYYRVDLIDRAGNPKYAYVHIAKDIYSPTVSLHVEKVNVIGDVNYVGINSVVDVTVTDNGSGIHKDGNTTYDYDTYKNTSTYSIKELLPSSANEYNITDIEDNLGHRIPKEPVVYNNVEEWQSDFVAPEFAPLDTKSVRRNQYSQQATSDNSQITLTGASTGWESITIKNTNNTYSFSVSQVNGFAFAPKFKTDNPGDAWYVKVNDSTKPDFVSWESKTIESGGTYQFTSESWNNESAYYFYPIDKAGNVGNAFIITFKKPIEPTIGQITVINKKTENQVSYFNKNSSIKVPVTNPSSKDSIKITGYSVLNGTGVVLDYAYPESDVKTIGAGSNTTITISCSDIPDEKLKTFNLSKLSVLIKTEDTSKQQSLSNKYTYYGECAEFEIDSVTGTNASGSTGYAYKKDSSTICYGNNTANVNIAFKKTGDSLIQISYYSTDAENWSESITIRSFESDISVYAKDELGNISTTAMNIKFEIDDSVAAPTFTPGSSGVYWDAANTKLYFKSTASFKVTGDSDVAYYYVDSTQNKSTNGEFSLDLADGIHSVYAVDKVNNISDPYVFTAEKDDTVSSISTGTFTFYKAVGETLGSPVENAAEVTTGSDNTITITYNESLINTVKFVPETLTDSSGIAKYVYSYDGTNWIDSDADITFNLGTSQTVRIKVVDRVGNESERLKISLTKDTGVSLKTNGTATFGSIEVNKLNVTPSSDIVQGHDDVIGNGYTTNFISENATFTAESTGRTPYSYAIVTGSDNVAPTEPTAFTTITTELSGNNLTLPFPEMTKAHDSLFLWVKDSLGKANVYAVYNGSNGWWLTYKKPGSFEYSVSSDKNTVIITGLQNVPVTKIEPVFSAGGGNITKAVFYFNAEKNTEVTSNFTNINNCFSETGKIELTLNTWNNPEISDIKITYAGSNTPVSGTFVTRSFGFIASHYVEGLKHSFAETMNKITGGNSKQQKTKSVRLNNQSAVANVSAPEMTTSVSNKDTVKPLIAKNADKKQKNKSSKADLKNKASAVSISSESGKTEENYIEMEATAITVTEDTATASALNYVQVTENNNLQKDYSKLIYGIVSLVMCAVIAMVVIVNKIIIDKTK